MRLTINIVVLVLIGAIFWLAALFSSKSRVRFCVRLDLIGLDGVSRHATSVWESRIISNPFGGYHMTLRGEAIVVGDGANGAYAALLSSTYSSGGLAGDNTVMLPENLFWKAVKPLLRGNEVADRVRANRLIGQHPGWSRSMTYAEGLAARYPLPFLVHLPDRNSPAGVTAATPTSAAIGPNPTITITITDEKVTTGIAAKLPWMKDRPINLSLDGKRFDLRRKSGLANQIGTGDFSYIKKH